MNSEVEKNSRILTGIFMRDNKIITEIIDDNIKMIRRYVLMNNGEEKDIRIVMNDAVVAIYRKKEIPVLTVKFSTYFYSVCKNIWQYKLSKKINEREKLLFSDLEEYTPEDEICLYTDEQIEFVRNSIDLLNNDCQKVIKMFNYGLSIKELTRLMNYKNDQITRNKRSLCLDKLMEIIQKNPKYEELKDEQKR